MSDTDTDTQSLFTIRSALIAFSISAFLAVIFCAALVLSQS